MVYQYKNAVAVPWYSDCITVVQNQMVLWYFELKLMSGEEIRWCLCSHPKNCMYIYHDYQGDYTLKIPQQYIFVSLTHNTTISKYYMPPGV